MSEGTLEFGLIFLAAKKVTRLAGKSGAKRHLLRWLISLGGLGLFGVGIIDSSVIPLPLPGSTDLLLLLLTAHRGTTIPTGVWLAFCALSGSLIGGYLTWSTGRKGGEVTLEKSIPPRLLGTVKDWVERHGAWSVGLAAILPPPIPLTPFLLAAGALKVERVRFLVFYGLARMVRYGLLAWLGLTYGRRIVKLWEKDLARWTGPVLWVYGSLVVLGIGYGFWRYAQKKRVGQIESSETKEMA